ncbi:MAG: hypothetical protein ACK4GO_03090 [Gemmobacter sp.]
MFLLATAAAVAMPALANAAVVVFTNTLVADENYTFATVIQPGDSIEYRFTVLENLNIPQFSMSATGNNAEADVREIRFGFMQPVTGMFTTIQSIGSVAAGFGFMEGASFSAGDMFAVIFQDGITNDVSLTLSFGTEVSAVPLPATGLLLAPFLLAGGIAGWRRRKSAQVAA